MSARPAIEDGEPYKTRGQQSMPGPHPRPDGRTHAEAFSYGIEHSDGQERGDASGRWGRGNGAQRKAAKTEPGNMPGSGLFEGCGTGPHQQRVGLRP